ncbi:[FeFe] hydrogenase, group A, partial [Myxococcota bacterium]|nr:[FeFe] hydrogenase, group A [Myxococcota bacterium]
MIRITVNNHEHEVSRHDTILGALEEIGIKVPTLCHLKGLTPSGACRMCVVEMEDTGNLVPSCAWPLTDGLRIKTHSGKVLTARKTIVELLLSNHPDDCLYCRRRTDCELLGLASSLGVDGRGVKGRVATGAKDLANPAIIRDPSKCILCGRCVRVCEEVQGVSAIDFIGRGAATIVGTAFNESLNIGSCVNCGQCVRVCPTGALMENPQISRVLEALADPGKVVVAQHAPAVSVTVGELWGSKPGEDLQGVMTSALRQMGFDRVFDTSFAADLTIMEEASELVHRIRSGGQLPMMTSCSPGWVKFVEQCYPEFIGGLSSCKSPQQMLGAMVKSYWAETEGIDPKDIFHVAIMPCTAKKYEAARPEMVTGAHADIDAVLTTRELHDMLRMSGIDMEKVTPEPGDNPFGQRSSAGKLFGATGGVMEAALRTAHYMLTGENMARPIVTEVRELQGVKEASLEIAGLTLKVAVAHGLKNAARVLDEVRQGRELHFLEVMTCPGGCIGGG